METRIRGLYVIVDPAACRGRHPVEIARQAIDGGASMIQWRDKLRDKGDQLADASAIEEVCRNIGVLFIVNDHADLALAVGAAGVHVGPHDLPVERVRSIVGDAMIIGASTNNAREALRAQQDGADYVAVGAIFPTGTKGDTRPANLDRIREVKSAVRLPVVAIGGIDASNIAGVIEAGADAAAVISAVCGADDPAEATRRLAAAFPFELQIELAHGSDAEARVRDRLRALVERHECSPWIATKRIVIDAEAPTPHSHPALTLNTRPLDDDQLLATFLHEQVHWTLTLDKATPAIAAYRARWPELPAARPDGAGDEFSTYLHVAVNYLELLTLRRLIGSARARAVIEFWADDHYRAIYRLILDEEDAVADIARRTGLAPASTGSRDLHRAVEQYAALFNAGDRDAWVALFAEHALQHDPVGEPPRRGRAEIAAWWERAVAPYEAIIIEPKRITVNGNEAALSWRIVERQDGKQRAFEGIDIITFDAQGLISEVRAYWDRSSLPEFV